MTEGEEEDYKNNIICRSCEKKLSDKFVIIVI